MTLEEFENLKTKAEEELKFDKTNVAEKNMMLPNMYQKWLGIFNTEASRLSIIRMDLEKKRGELYQFYKFDDKAVHDTRQEIEGCIAANPEYLAIKAKEIKQVAIVDWLEGTLNNIKQLSFSLRNYIEFQKVQLGMGTL